MASDVGDRILDRVDGEYAIRLAQRLVRIPSDNPPGDVSKVADLLLEEFRRAGLTPAETYEPAPGKPNFIFTLGEGRPAPGTHLTIGCHMDTVPVRDEERHLWKLDPYGGIIADGRLHGRGSADMKGGVAAVVAAARAIRASGVPFPGTLTIMVVADGESADVHGLMYLNDRGLLRGDLAIYTESTNLGIIRLFKGRIFCELTIQGKPVHVSVPHQGVNAVEKLAAIVQRFTAHRFVHAPHPILGPATLAFSQVRGGSAVNVVAGWCRATFDVRIVPGQTVDGAMAELQAVLAGMRREDPTLDVDLAVMPGGGRDVVDVPPSAPVIRLLEEIIPRVTGRPAEFLSGVESPGGLFFFVRRGIPGVFFGPGTAIWDAHMPNESVPTANIAGAARILALAAARVCGAA